MPVSRWSKEHVAAWTVRFDLWPPGTRAVLTSLDPATGYQVRLRLAYAWPGSWDTAQLVMDRLEKYTLPGAAEALVLAGMVIVVSVTNGLDGWVEVDPCP